MFYITVAVVATQMHTFVKIHWVIRLKVVHFIAYCIYLNNSDLQKTKDLETGVLPSFKATSSSWSKSQPAWPQAPPAPLSTTVIVRHTLTLV